MGKECITLYQRRASPLPGKNDPEFEFISSLGKISNTIIFPEYFTFHPRIQSLDDLLRNSQETLKKLIDLSLEKDFSSTMIVGGTVILSKDNRLYNASPVIYNGSIMQYYYKRSLFLKENEHLSRGAEGVILENPATGDLWGFLICSDVNHPDYFLNYKKVKYIAIPVASPFLPEDTPEARLNRDISIFQNGAKESGALLFKCCLTGQTGTIYHDKTPLHPSKVQGRSLIAAPEEILARAPDIDWQGALCYSTLNAGVQTISYTG